jgi:hypothetical protein
MLRELVKQTAIRLIDKQLIELPTCIAARRLVS